MRDVGTGGPPGWPGCRLYFHAAETIVVVELGEPSLLEPARQLFPAYEVPPPACAGRGHVDILVESTPDGFVVTSHDAPVVVCGTPMDTIAALEFALTRAIAKTFTDHVHVHASGAVIDGRAVLALGTSGAGKSSLAASMLARGFRVLGDDTVFLGADATAAPFKRLLKVPRVVLERLGVDLSTTVHWDPAWPEAWLDPRDGPGWAEAAPVAAIALVQYSPSAPLTVLPVEAAEGLNALVQSVMSTGISAAAGFDRLIRAARSAKLYHLEFSSAIDASDILSSLTQ